MSAAAEPDGSAADAAAAAADSGLGEAFRCTTTKASAAGPWPLGVASSSDHAAAWSASGPTVEVSEDGVGDGAPASAGTSLAPLDATDPDRGRALPPAPTIDDSDDPAEPSRDRRIGEPERPTTEPAAAPVPPGERDDADLRPMRRVDAGDPPQDTPDPSSPPPRAVLRADDAEDHPPPAAIRASATSPASSDGDGEARCVGVRCGRASSAAVY